MPDGGFFELPPQSAACPVVAFIVDDLRYADVAVDSPVGHGRSFTYHIPGRISVQPGQLVWAPFGSQTLQGIVVELSSSGPDFATRDILQAVDPAPLVDEERIDLGKWMSQRYRCSLFTALSPMLPPGFESHVRSRIFPSPNLDAGETNLREESRAAIEALGEKGRMAQAEFVKLLGRRGARELNRLVEQGAVRREVSIPKPGVAPRYEGYLVPAMAGDSANEGLTTRQQALLDAVRQPPGHLPLAEANREFGPAAAAALWRKGLVAQDWWRTSGGPPPAVLASDTGAPGTLTLTAEQQQALSQITSALDSSFASRPHSNPPAPGGGAPLSARTFLLHGVTGSGKTEVYLRAIAHAVSLGRRAVFLVPEIALTPQTLERVNAWFEGRVALIHSGQTARQKFDQWWDIRGGAFDVVVGPRSALFAPLDNLGLIVIDEEHEWTYKQEESPPLYHARTAALELARRTGAAVVLGSATPSVETYYHATRGRVRLLSLPHRVAGGTAAGVPSGAEPPEPAPLASVRLCDMRQELREGNRSIFSRALTEGLRDCLNGGSQAILFLNRRGSSSIVQCRDCGYVATCRRCTTSLTCHSGPPRLLCHQCNYSRRTLDRCPECRGKRIRQLGIGTERVVSEVGQLFPGTRVDRLDSDATRSPGSAEEAVARLASGETQVLVGTQMVAKGLDVPNVALVGVVLADVGLHIPDFRAGERAFALLCQVAGRAGRGGAPGRVFVQTYNPGHYAIQAGARQNYLEMYRREIDNRRELGYPPFNQLAHIVYQNRDADAAQRQATAIADELKRRSAAQGRTDIVVSGPAPGMPPRLRGRHRWRLLLRGRGLPEFLDDVDFPAGCVVDIDPAHVV